jgi:hypothetical protein
MDAVGNHDKNDHHCGEQPSSVPLLFIREEGYYDYHENADQCEHALLSEVHRRSRFAAIRQRGCLKMMTWITRRTPICIAAAALILVVFSSAVRADADFELWLKQLWLDAQQRGVSQATFNGAMTGLQLDLSLPDLVIPGRTLKEQAEFVKFPADYLPEQQLSELAKAGRRHLLFWVFRKSCGCFGQL